MPATAPKSPGTEFPRRLYTLMTKEPIYDQPSEVTVTDGVVSVKGPDSVDVELTAEAADETSDRLLEASLKARGQIIREQQRRKH